MAIKKRAVVGKPAFEFADVIILSVLVIAALIIIIPLINVIATSFATQKEFLDTPLLLFPNKPTLQGYEALFSDGRIGMGYRTTLQILALLCR